MLASTTGVNGGEFTLILRTAAGVAVADPLRRLSFMINRAIAPPPVLRIEGELSQSIALQRFTMSLVAVFAVLALLLAAVGVYSAILYMVVQCNREIGIRVALGATPRQIAGAVAGMGLGLSCLRLVFGLFASTWATKLVQNTL